MPLRAGQFPTLGTLSRGSDRGRSGSRDPANGMRLAGDSPRGAERTTPPTEEGPDVSHRNDHRRPVRRLLRTTIATLPALLLAAAPAAGLAATITVPDDVTSVRDAVEGAGPGDVIRVRPGIYAERVRIENGQTGLVLEAFDEGGLGDRPVLTPDPTDDGIRVKDVAGVTIRGFEIQGGSHGVRLEKSDGSQVLEVKSTGSREGIRVKQSTGVTISDCEVQGARTGRGIRIEQSANATVDNCTLNLNRQEGVKVVKSPGTTITASGADENRGDGIRVIRSDGSTVSGNTTDGNTRSGIRIEVCPGTVVSGNGANDNGQYGIRVQKSAPIAAVADLTGAGNTATGNGLLDLRVQ